MKHKALINNRRRSQAVLEAEVAERYRNTEVFTIREGEWLLKLDGTIVKATFNSRGAALAAIDVERARRLKALEVQKMLRERMTKSPDVNESIARSREGWAK